MTSACANLRIVGQQAGLWGLLAGGALVIGAAVAWFVRVPQRLIAAVMAFGSGVLISALAFDLMDEAYRRGGLDSTGVGFVAGAAIYTAANWLLARHGAKHRKRSGEGRQSSEENDSGSGMAIAVGALLDGIPESIVIGLSMLQGGTVSLVAVIAIFLSNIPEGLSSAAGMRKAGRPAAYVFGLWGAIAVASVSPPTSAMRCSATSRPTSSPAPPRSLPARSWQCSPTR